MYWSCIHSGAVSRWCYDLDDGSNWWWEGMLVEGMNPWLCWLFVSLTCSTWNSVNWMTNTLRCLLVAFQRIPESQKNLLISLLSTFPVHLVSEILTISVLVQQGEVNSCHCSQWIDVHVNLEEGIQHCFSEWALTSLLQQATCWQGSSGYLGLKYESNCSQWTMIHQVVNYNILSICQRLEMEGLTHTDRRWTHIEHVLLITNVVAFA